MSDLKPRTRPRPSMRFERPTPDASGRARLVISTALALCLLGGGFAPQAMAQATETGAGGRASQLVQAVVARVRPGRQSISLTGEIEARDTLDASFPAAGRISDVLVEEGEQVRKGQELARTESVSQKQALRSRDAALTTARANLAQARSEFERQDSLLERGAATRVARDEAEDAMLGAEASVAEAQAARDLAQKDLTDTVLLAPEDALVTARNVEVGQVVGAAETVIELAIGAEYDAVLDVPEVMLTVQRNAPPVHLKLLDVDAPAFMGEPREISPLVDPDLGTVEVKVGVIDPPPQISIGASVRATVRFEDPPVVSLPFSALTATAEGPAVWVVNADPDAGTGSVALRQVELLRHETGRVVIASGLEDGETVVSLGVQLLYEGARVRVTFAQTEGTLE